MTKFNTNINEERIVIYCDGGCRGNNKKENICGYGSVLLYKQYKKEIYQGFKNTTNNRMEIKAVIESLKAIKKPYIPVEIRTDSAYVCNCLNQKWYLKWMNNGWLTSKGTTVENRDLWIELVDQLGRFANISFVKVKGHSDDEGNNLADHLANKAMDSVK